MSMTDRMRFYMAGSIAESIAKSYDKAVPFWLSYADSLGLPSMPIDPIHLGNCLTTIADSSGSFASISTLVAAVARQYWDQFLPSPTENFAFRRLLQGFKRHLSKPSKKKDPLT